MATQKKIDTGSMIKGIIVNPNASSKTLEKIKKDRFSNSNEEVDPNKVPVVNTFNSESIKEKLDNITNSQKNTLTKSETKLWDDLNNILDSEFYRDKKSTFLMSLSGDCLCEYEKIANGITYKTNKKVSRNEIIRKVLEDFIHSKKNTLENIITKL